MLELSEMFLYNPIYWILIIICLIIIFVGTKYYPNIIGWFGEHYTRQELKKLPKDKYIVINNILISINGVTHQIDHVVVSPYGIFSIETKQYNGYFTGTKYDKKWVRHCGRKKYYYTNPVRQNYGHVKSLSELLNIDESKIYNVVCISGNSRFKVKHDGECVANQDLLKKIYSYKNIVLRNYEEIANMIIKSNITDKNVMKEHIRNIKKQS